MTNPSPTLKLPLDPDTALRTELRLAIQALAEAASEHKTAAQRFDIAAQRLAHCNISIRTRNVQTLNVYGAPSQSTMAANEADQLAQDFRNMAAKSSTAPRN